MLSSMGGGGLLRRRSEFAHPKLLETFSPTYARHNRHTPTKFDRHWPNWGRFGPTLANLGPKLAERGQTGPKLANRCVELTPKVLRGVTFEQFWQNQGLSRAPWRRALVKYATFAFSSPPPPPPPMYSFQDSFCSMLRLHLQDSHEPSVPARQCADVATPQSHPRHAACVTVCSRTLRQVRCPKLERVGLRAAEVLAASVTSLDGPANEISFCWSVETPQVDWSPSGAGPVSSHSSTRRAHHCMWRPPGRLLKPGVATKVAVSAVRGRNPRDSSTTRAKQRAGTPPLGA